jgi:hypothetical protein
MAHDVFISYATEDKTVADAVCHTLEDRGIRCWIAPRDVDAGQFGASILNAITASRVMVLVLSAHSNASKDVLSEVVSALNRGVTVIPLRLEDGVPTGSMEYHLTGIHWLDALTGPLQKHLNDLADKVEGYLGTERPPPPPTRSKPSPWPRLAKIGGTIVLLLAAVLAASLLLRGRSTRGSISQVEKYILFAGVGVGTEIAKFTYRLPNLETDMSDSARQMLTLSLRAIRFEDPDGFVDTLARFMSGLGPSSSPGSVSTSLGALIEIVKPLETFVQRRYGGRGTGLLKIGLNIGPITHVMVYQDEAERFRMEGKLTPQQDAEVSLTLKRASETHQNGLKNSLNQAQLPRRLVSTIAFVADSNLSLSEERAKVKMALLSFFAMFSSWPER